MDFIDNNIRNHSNAWHLVGGDLNYECNKNYIGYSMLSDIFLTLALSHAMIFLKELSTHTITRHQGISGGWTISLFRSHDIKFIERCEKIDFGGNLCD